MAAGHDPVQGLQSAFLAAHGLPKVHWGLELEDRRRDGEVEEHKRQAIVQGVVAVGLDGRANGLQPLQH
eukprot:1380534-Alexandrium_andersonii.AAC.1